MKNLKVITTLFIAAVIFSNASVAQSFKALEKQDNFSVKYIGSDDNYLTFQIDVKDINDNTPVLIISDKLEVNLYTQNWSSKFPFMLFKIEKQQAQELTFNLSIGNKVISKTFSSSTKLVEETTVVENGFAIR